jgi:hypothetical protein
MIGEIASTAVLSIIGLGALTDLMTAQHPPYLRRFFAGGSGTKFVRTTCAKETEEDE